MQRTSRTARAPGFTLMEVLISIGVAAIGILGVLTLLPLAQHQAFQGLLEDRKAAEGHAAFRDFRVFGFMQPQRWVINTSSGDSPSWAFAAPQGYLPQGTAYCIDPLMLNATPDPTFTASPATRLGRLQATRPVGVVLPGGSNGSATATAFPNSTTMPPVLLMPRVSIAAIYGPGVGPGGVLTLPMAEHLCVNWDDIIYNIPDDKTQLPQQMDVANGVLWPTVDPTGTQNANVVGVPSRRQAGGGYSWFATVVPQQGTDLDLYTVSIAVCYRRRFDLLAHPEAERSLGINFLSSNEITLAGPTVESVDLRPGQWILISAQPPANGPVTPMPVHKWYRIVQVEAEPQGSGPFARTVTIHGPDWQAAWGTSAQATVVDTVVGVYEKLLRLETNSLWIPQ